MKNIQSLKDKIKLLKTQIKDQEKRHSVTILQLKKANSKQLESFKNKIMSELEDEFTFRADKSID